MKPDPAYETLWSFNQNENMEMSHKCQFNKTLQSQIFSQDTYSWQMSEAFCLPVPAALVGLTCCGS